MADFSLVRRTGVVIAFVLAACTPSPAATGPVPSAPPTAAAPSPASSTPLTPSDSPTTAPTAAAIVLPDHSAGCSAIVTPQLPAGDSTITVIAGGTERTALVHVPSNRAAGGSPLVIALHGAYGNPADHAAGIGMNAVADEHGFVVAYPAAIGDGQIWGIRTEAGRDADTAFISALLDRMEATACLNPRRVYLSGFSAGGAMAKVLACRLDGRIAGVELVSAVYGPELGDCLPAHPVPTLVFAGVLDPLLPYYGGRIPISLFADWPPVIGVDAFVNSWAANNGCTGDPVVGDVIGAFAEPVTYQGCAAKTMLYRLGDAGHTWPGIAFDGPFGRGSVDVSASELLWSFFNGD